MGGLDREARNAMGVLLDRGHTKSDVARLLGVSEGTVRYYDRRRREGAVDGRSRQQGVAAEHGAAIAHWQELQGAGGDQPGRAACLADPGARLRREPPLGAALLEADVSGAGVAGASPGGDAAGGAGAGGLGALPRCAGGLGAGRPGGVPHGAVVEPEGGGGVGPRQGYAVVAVLPHGCVPAPGRGAGDGAGRQREDRGLAGCEARRTTPTAGMPGSYSSTWMLARRSSRRRRARWNKECATSGPAAIRPAVRSPVWRRCRPGLTAAWQTGRAGDAARRQAVRRRRPGSASGSC